MSIYGILLACFAAAALGVYLAIQLGTDFLFAYRNYFATTVDPDLKRSFVDARWTHLFAASLVVTAGFSIVGLFYLGPPGAVFGLVLGLLLPHVLLRRLLTQRTERFVYQLPDALHSLSASLRAGVNLPRGLEQLATWQPAPLSQEFGVVLAEYKIGRDLQAALTHLQQRLDRPELEMMTSAMNISRSVGGNLADTLESLANTLSEKAGVEGKINALTAMGRMQGWVVSAIPLLMGVAMFLLDPEKMMPLFTEISGWMTLAVVGVMMVMAVVTIRKIVNIDV